MPRIKISEFKAKSLLVPFWGKKYKGISIKKGNDFKSQLKSLSSDKKYVLKVDEGVKKRNKNGLICLQISKSEIEKCAKSLFSKGFDTLLLEEFIPHDKSEEKYISFEQVRDGIRLLYSDSGGIEIESETAGLKTEIIKEDNLEKVAEKIGFPFSDLTKFYQAFTGLYLTFLEINPLLIGKDGISILDAAVEVDSAAEFFVGGKWDLGDQVDNEKSKLPEEIEVKKLAARSSASFKLVVLNPKGSLFTIFSGGGASIVLADEVENIGEGRKLANYAEYSGGPNEEETYLFTKSILSLAIKSPARDKKIYIAGGVANFTDIRATFKGVIKALDEKKSELKKQNIKVFVRRGGPFQEEGLSMMANFLEKAGLLGEVMGPERVLTEVITTN